MFSAFGGVPARNLMQKKVKSFECELEYSQTCDEQASLGKPKSSC